MQDHFFFNFEIIHYFLCCTHSKYNYTLLISCEDLKFVPHFWKLRTQPCEEKCWILRIFLGFNANFSLEDYTEYHWMNYSSSEKPILSLVYAKSLKICCKERVIKDERNKQKLNVKEMLNWLQLDNTCLWQNECFWWRPCTKSSPKISEYFVNTHSQRCYFFLFPPPIFSDFVWTHSHGCSILPPSNLSRFLDTFYFSVVNVAAAFDTWSTVCEDYATQLEQEGQYHKAATYLLAAHKVYNAIDLFKRHRLFK